jgi:hypothetical protein
MNTQAHEEVTVGLPPAQVPVYEWILQHMGKRLRASPILASLALGLGPFAVGVVLAWPLGDASQFCALSARLIYWAVIACAFLIMHSVYAVWMEYRPYVADLFQQSGESERVLGLFANRKWEMLAAVGCVLFVEFYYFTLKPQTTSLFTYWYVCFCIALAATAASFGVYFSVVLLILARSVSTCPTLKMCRLAPATTPGIMAIDYLSSYCGVAYVVELLVILTGIVLGPWGTDLKLSRLVLAGGTVAITVWTAVNFTWTQYCLGRVIHRERLRSIKCLESLLEAQDAPSSSEAKSVLDLVDRLHTSPGSLLTWSGVVRSALLAIVPWTVVLLQQPIVKERVLDILQRVFGISW